MVGKWTWRSRIAANALFTLPFDAARDFEALISAAHRHRHHQPTNKQTHQIINNWLRTLARWAELLQLSKLEHTKISGDNKRKMPATTTHTDIYLVLRNVKIIIRERAKPQIEVTDKFSHLCAKAGQRQPFIMFGCHEQRRNMTPARSEREPLRTMVAHNQRKHYNGAHK